jgi:hypothetical protein
MKLPFFQNLNNRAKIIIFGFAGFVLITILLTVLASTSQEANIKRTIATEIERTDFDVDETVVEDGDWLLVRIASTNREDSGNPAYNILEKEENGTRLVLGPGTHFDIDSLADKGVPSSIIKYLLGDGPHFVRFNFINSIARSEDGREKIEQLVASYAKMNKVSVFTFTLQEDTYRDELLTNYPTLNDRADYFDVKLDNSQVVHIRIISPAYGDVTYELYDENNTLVFSVK